MCGRDWAHLPEEPLIDIASRLKCVVAMSSFPAVCSSWRAVSHMVKPSWAPAFPCLVSPVSTKNEPSCEWSVFDLSTNKHCIFERLETLPLHCKGCEDGWIFTVSSDLDVQLFNPVTKAEISLPSTQGLPAHFFTITTHLREHFMKDPARIRRIRRAIVAKIPPNDELLVLVVYHLDCLASAKPGDDVWTFVTHQGWGACVEDMIIFNGRILILFGDGRLVGSSLERFLKNRGNQNLVFEEYVAGYLDGDTSIYAENSRENLHLVESFGDILMVLRHTRSFVTDDLEEERDIGFDWDCVTLRFEVFKLDPEAREWAKVDDLGDVSLFVGNHCAMAVSASNAIKPNCIYFTDDEHLSTGPNCRGVGIFDLQSGEIEELCPKYRERYVLSSRRSPSWFMPKFV